MKNRKLWITTALVLFGAFLVISGIFLIRNQTPIKTSSQPPEINFSETGYIINWDSESGTHTDTWKLVYEKPGAPALEVDLIFEDESLSAGLDDEDNGRRAHVEGIREGDDVLVKKLTILNSNPGNETQNRAGSSSMPRGFTIPLIDLGDQTRRQIAVVTYGHWVEGEAPYVVCVRLKLEELDEMALGKN